MPRFDSWLDDQTGIGGGVARVAAELISNIPIIIGTAVLGATVGAPLALAKGFQILGGVGVARQLSDVDAWKADPLGHGTETFQNGLIVFGPMMGRSGAEDLVGNSVAEIQYGHRILTHGVENALESVGGVRGGRGFVVRLLARAHDAKGGYVRPVTLPPEYAGRNVSGEHVIEINELIQKGSNEWSRTVTHELWHSFWRTPYDSTWNSFLQRGYDFGGDLFYFEETGANLVQGETFHNAKAQAAWHVDAKPANSPRIRRARSRFPNPYKGNRP